MKNFEPIYVHDFMKNGNFHITDGHTRAFIAWKYGIKQIPYIYDESEIVASETGQIQSEYNLKKDKLAKNSLFVYGLSEDRKTLYYENYSGDLFEAPYNSV